MREEQDTKDNFLDITDKVKDTDLFFHGTSLKNYFAIQRSEFLRSAPPRRNCSNSRKGIYFHKYSKKADPSINGFIEKYLRLDCERPCRLDGSLEGVVLQIRGKELKKLGCPIFTDPNYIVEMDYNEEGVPIGVKSNPLFLSIIIDRDIPLKYLKVAKRLSLKASEL